MHLRHAVLVVASAAGLIGCSGSDESAANAADSSNPGEPATVPSTLARPGGATAPGTRPTSTSRVATTEPPAPSETAASTQPPPTMQPAPTTELARSYDFAAVGALIDTFVADNGMNGAALVVVERDDGIVFEHYAGEFTADRVSLIASSSKMLVAGVLLHLADQGLLDPDQPIAEYVPWAAGHNEQVTVTQLVSNSAGLVGLMPDPGYTPYVCQFVATAEIETCAAQIWTTPDDDADIVPPDTEYRYGGAQWQIAGAVAETVSGKPWAQLVDEIYVEPCDLETLGFNNHWVTLAGGGFQYPSGFDGDVAVLTPTDNPHMEGGAYTNARDYAELLLMHLRDGRCGDSQILEPDTLARMHSDHIGPAFGGTTQTGSGYGFGWWIYPEEGRIDDPGAYGATPWLDLADGYGAFLLVEQTSTLPRELFGPVEAAMTAARGAG